METFRQWLYLGPGNMQLETVEKVEPGEGMVRLKVMAMSICGSDLAAYKTGNYRMKPPLVVGHEFCGIVDALGPKVTKFQVGQRVTVNPVLRCGKCYHCKENRPNMCPHRHNTGTTVFAGRWDGGLREYTYMPEFSLVPLPDSLSFLQGALVEPTAVCLHAASAGHISQEVSATVVGAGAIGLLVTNCLKALGVKQVICTDIVNSRLDRAKEWGADAVVNSAKEDPVAAVQRLTSDREGTDRVILCTDVDKTFIQGLEMCRMGGSVVLVGHIRSNVTFQPEIILRNGLSILSSVTFLPEHFYSALRLIEQHQVDPTKLITSVVPFAQARDAFDLLCDPNNKEIKIMIKIHDEW